MERLSHNTCRRCGHNWLPRSLPVHECPSCKSYHWRFTVGEFKEYRRRAREAKLKQALHAKMPHRKEVEKVVQEGSSHKGETRNVA